MVLTDRRVVYRGRGWKRHQMASMHLEDVTIVGIGRYISFVPALLIVPILILALGFGMAVAVEDGDPFFFSWIFAALTLPLPWMNMTLAVRIGWQGHVVRVRVRGDPAGAAGFVRQVEVARAARRQGVEEAPRPTPTAAHFA